MAEAPGGVTPCASHHGLMSAGVFTEPGISLGQAPELAVPVVTTMLDGGGV